MDEILGIVFPCHTDPTPQQCLLGTHFSSFLPMNLEGFVASRGNGFIFKSLKDLGAGERKLKGKVEY